MVIGVFRLVRSEDETGVSGTGVVAYGTAYPNGKVAMAWHAPDRPQSVAVYDSLEDVVAIHIESHKETTRLEWLSLIDLRNGQDAVGTRERVEFLNAHPHPV